MDECSVVAVPAATPVPCAEDVFWSLLRGGTGGAAAALSGATGASVRVAPPPSALCADPPRARSHGFAGAAVAISPCAAHPPSGTQKHAQSVTQSPKKKKDKRKKHNANTRTPKMRDLQGVGVERKGLEFGRRSSEQERLCIPTDDEFGERVCGRGEMKVCATLQNAINCPAGRAPRVRVQTLQTALLFRLHVQRGRS